jgi:asparagine synthase (glutamine-hydrolysing)
MCGIAGIVSPSGLLDPTAGRLRTGTMLQSLAHRGPDAAQQFTTDRAAMGVARLTIRGLEDCSQPMHEPGSGIVVVCNGEIDNHQELRQWLAERGRPVQHQTDVAVIPGLFLELGEEFVHKLTGAFALAVWDRRTRLLFLARDRAGERSLFFTFKHGVIRFATELAALVSGDALCLGLNQAALRNYLQLGIFPSPETPFEEIHKVAPGELVVLDGTHVRRNRYWRWQIVETRKQEPSLEEFDSIFRKAVQRQSDIDVDFGVFLSGGLDSSLISAVLRDLRPNRPLKAYSLRFAEESFNESDVATAVARKLGLEIITVEAQPEDVRAELKLLVRRVGEPLADPAWLPSALLARRASQDIQMALVGEGADELFGGYPTYVGANVAERISHLPRWLKAIFRRAIENLPPTEKKVTVSFLLKRFVQGLELEGLDRHRIWVSNIPPAVLRRLGLPDSSALVSTVDENQDASLLDLIQRWDLETTLAEGLLTKADRASMSSALELRAPFLDEAVMEFAKSLPVSERVHGFTTKVFLKRYALRYLPTEIVHRRKRGLSVPIARWLRGPLRDWAGSTLASGRLEQVGISSSAVLDLFAEHCDHKADHGRALWTLLVLDEWLDWRASRPASTEQGLPSVTLNSDTRRSAHV